MHRIAITDGKPEATAILKMRGMSESGGARRIRPAADELDGALLMDINYISDNVTVRYDADKLTRAQLKRRLDTGTRAPV